ncbi:MAG: hypothetical protein KJ698_12800 [Actinobacteria bacterium]|nr:hypothetical protein [Actinomycetota bacterium]MBU1494647.1 hypothetical protein [Actinomycetota bacterium]MBU1866044.1 hypothetical protein [Actinomycetota bacterium]
MPENANGGPTHGFERFADRLNELVRQWSRGALLEVTLVLERHVDQILGAYFCGPKVRDDFLAEVLGRMSGASRLDILISLARAGRLPSDIEQELEVVRDLRRLRNLFAHAMGPLSNDEALACGLDAERSDTEKLWFLSAAARNDAWTGIDPAEVNRLVSEANDATATLEALLRDLRAENP